MVLGQLKLLHSSFSTSLLVPWSLPLLRKPPPQEAEHEDQDDQSKLLRTTQCISLPLLRPVTIQRAIAFFGSDNITPRRMSSQANDGTDTAFCSLLLTTSYGSTFCVILFGIFGISGVLLRAVPLFLSSFSDLEFVFNESAGSSNTSGSLISSGLSSPPSFRSLFKTSSSSSEISRWVSTMCSACFASTILSDV